MGKGLLKLAINIPSAIWVFVRWFSISWIENYISPVLAKLSLWTGISMPIIEGLLIGAVLVGSIWWLVSGLKGKRTATEKASNESDVSYVDKIIVDSKATDLLAIPAVLQALSELDYDTYQKLRLIKRSKTIVKSIQSQLRQDWRMRPVETFENLDNKTIRATIENTIRNLRLETKKLDEETMIFMLHVAGVLDDHKIGISKYRENDENYSRVNRLKAKVETHELRNAIRMYNWYSLGMCSILLLIAIFPNESVQSIQKQFGKTSTELKAEREDTLGYIMTKINSLVREELRGSRK